jgi:hypothetical protein
VRGLRGGGLGGGVAGSRSVGGDSFPSLVDGGLGRRGPGMERGCSSIQMKGGVVEGAGAI